jgi:nicotinamidase-related amidase
VALTLDPKRCVVLAMDLQRSIVERFPDAAAGVLPRAKRVIDAARAAHVPVGYVVVGFRPGFPEVSARNLSFSAIRSRGGLGAPEVHPDVAPRGDEWIVTKHRVGAFEGTDLEMLLRAAERDTLVLCGIATSGVVLSTLRAAADKDYALVVVEDACADADPEVHRVLVEKVFPRQATVAKADEVAAALAHR